MLNILKSLIIKLTENYNDKNFCVGLGLCAFDDTGMPVRYFFGYRTAGGAVLKKVPVSGIPVFSNITLESAKNIEILRI